MKSRHSSRDLIKEINLDRTDTDDKFGFGIKAGKSSALGVLVNRVDKNSPAELEGLKPNDIILAVNGEDFTKLTLNEAKRIFAENTHIRMRVMRNITSKSSSQSVGWKDSVEFDVEAGQDSFTLENVHVGRASIQEPFGFTLTSTFEADKPSSIRIDDVKTDSPASRADLKTNDELVEVNDRRITNLNDFCEILKIIKNSLILVMLLKRKHETRVTQTQLSKPISKSGKKDSLKKLLEEISDHEDTNVALEPDKISRNISISNQSSKKSLKSILDALDQYERKRLNLRGDLQHLKPAKEEKDQLVDDSSCFYFSSVDLPDWSQTDMSDNDLNKLSGETIPIKVSVPIIQKKVVPIRRLFEEDIVSLEIKNDSEAPKKRAVLKRSNHVKKKKEKSSLVRIITQKDCATETISWPIEHATVEEDVIEEEKLFNIETESIIPEGPLSSKLVLVYEYPHLKLSSSTDDQLYPNETSKTCANTSLEYTQDGFFTVNIIKQPDWPTFFGLKLNQESNGEFRIDQFEKGSVSEQLDIIGTGMILVKVNDNELKSFSTKEEAENLVQLLFKENQILRFLFKSKI